MTLFRALAALAVLGGLLLLSDATSARQWKPTVLQAAQDYLQLEHAISDSEHVQLIWLAPQFIEGNLDNSAARSILGDYVLIAIVHYSVTDLGEFQIRPPESVVATSKALGDLKPIPDQELPPLVSAFVHAFAKALADGLGKVGTGMKTFVYDGSQIDSCKPGTLWVSYLKEKYEFVTPVPGCQ